MERKINLSPFIEVSYIINYDHHSLNRVASVLFQNSDFNYFFIEDELEKIYDVCQMPDYIKLDWINYNKKNIAIPVINKHIAYYTKNHQDDYDNEELLIALKSIRRELIINGIIS
jgi:hypothetical protein